MAWLRIDDRVRTHPKIAQAGPAAAWLWFCGICYAREHLTDGFLPKAVIPTLAGGLPRPWSLAAKLVEVRLWEDAAGGFMVHDFLEWNPSKADVMSLRDKERDKKRTQRGTDEGHQRDASRARAGDAGLGSPSGSDGVVLRGESAKEGIDPPRWNQHGRTPQHSALVTRHHRCDPDASEACGRGLCIPAFLVGQWRQQCGLDTPALTTASIQDFIRSTLERLPSGPIGDDPLHFWRAAWNAAHGSQAPAERKRSGGRESIAEQNLRGLREDLSRGH